jgi:hypothetical protein
LENWGLEIIESEGATGIASVCTILVMFFIYSLSRNASMKWSEYSP